MSPDLLVLNNPSSPLISILGIIKSSKWKWMAVQTNLMCRYLAWRMLILEKKCTAFFYVYRRETGTRAPRAYLRFWSYYSRDFGNIIYHRWEWQRTLRACPFLFTSYQNRLIYFIGLHYTLNSLYFYIVCQLCNFYLFWKDILSHDTVDIRLRMDIFFIDNINTIIFAMIFQSKVV